MFKQLTGDTFDELGKDGNSRVRKYNIFGMLRNRQLEVATYAIASGLQLVYFSGDSLITESEKPEHDTAATTTSRWINQRKTT